MSGADVLLERASLMSLQAQAQTSANGSCHLLACRDGWLAINLSRDSDWQLLPALLEQDEPVTTIDNVKNRLHTKSVHVLVERGALLGLALACATQPPDKAAAAFNIICRGKTRTHPSTQPLVVDLSSLWAGPLCSRLLQAAGARVIEVESTQRPDGMKLNTATGAQVFYQRLHAGKEQHQFDFRDTQQLQQLQKLIAKADIVIEGSRPRALKQLGIDAERMVKEQPGLVWVSITGYGREEPHANRIAFGDDAAIGAGLYDEVDGKPVFVGDAMADPLTGLQAALAAYTHWQRGEAVLLDINLHSVAKYAARYA